VEQQMAYFKLELVNRETSYNKLFGRQPNVGLMEVAGAKGRAAIEEREREIATNPARLAAAAMRAAGLTPGAPAGGGAAPAGAAASGSASGRARPRLPATGSSGRAGGAIAQARKQAGSSAAAGRAQGPRLGVSGAAGSARKRGSGSSKR